MVARPAVATALLTLSVLLAGCPGGDDSGGYVAPTAAPPSPASPPTPSPPPPGGGSVTCTASPEMALGPYYVDAPERQDIREDSGDVAEPAGDPMDEFLEAPARGELRLDAQGTPQEGTLLGLRLAIRDARGGSCAPLVGAQVDVWHANAAGRYSGFAQEGTVGEDWLRGHQDTDGDGLVEFTTIWPGWYPGRAVHIHTRVRDAEAGLDFVSQLFFDPADVADVYQDPPYSSRPTPDTPNARDGIYSQGGNRMILATSEPGGAWIGEKTIVVT